ncbi:heterokaryon incompatibility protein-domain-containing protein [Hypoxylon cercidicola]|nr:heterokaryon incompatibility protein-domain-containing protein [Hypoxylon cercidicola]
MSTEAGPSLREEADATIIGNLGYNGCTTCDIMRRAIELLPEQPDGQTKYVAWNMKTKDRTDMLHPTDSTHRELSLRVEQEPFVPDHDIQIYLTQPQAEDPSPWDIVPLNHHLPISTDSEESFAFAQPVKRVCSLQTRGCRNHCWGPPESITTQLNDKTYEEYKKGNPVAALSKTFFNTLAQGAEMCKIYENALLTLAAASSSSGHGGLFHRSPRLEITGSAPEKSGQAYRVFARFKVTHRFFDFPLMNSAWVLQERLLSPRTLHFTHQELVWECRSCNMVGFPVNSKLQPAAEHLEGFALVSKWHEVVKVYTQLKLTKTSDKLMVIDGVAQYKGPIRGTRHYAGLRADSFAFDLAWMVDTFNNSRSRSPEWRAPTWAWASMEVEVWWRTKEGDVPTPESHFAFERWPQLPQTDGRHPDPFLGLRGVLVKTTVAEADIAINSSPCLYEDCAEWSPPDGHTRDNESIYCLRLLGPENRLYSLMLRRTGPEGQNRYQRHGLLIFSADPNKENDTWNTRDKTRSKYSRNYQKGYPHWWAGGSISVVNII